jgi:hypothetical protein
MGCAASQPLVATASSGGGKEPTFPEPGLSRCAPQRALLLCCRSLAAASAIRAIHRGAACVCFRAA